MFTGNQVVGTLAPRLMQQQIALIAGKKKIKLH